MQEHAYPASHEPLIFLTMMTGILDDDAIEPQILRRLYHIMILTGPHDAVARRPRYTHKVWPAHCARGPSLVHAPQECGGVGVRDKAGVNAAARCRRGEAHRR
jgi:hypothetical protein